MDHLDSTSAAIDKRLMRVVDLAQRAFNAETALIIVIDRGRQLNLTTPGDAFARWPASSRYATSPYKDTGRIFRLGFGHA